MPFPSEYLENAARSGKVVLHFGLNPGGGLLRSEDFLVSQIKQAEVEQEDADGGHGLIFGFHNRFCRALVLVRRVYKDKSHTIFLTKMIWYVLPPLIGALPYPAFRVIPVYRVGTDRRVEYFSAGCQHPWRTGILVSSAIRQQ